MEDICDSAGFSGLGRQDSQPYPLSKNPALIGHRPFSRFIFKEAETLNCLKLLPPWRSEVLMSLKHITVIPIYKKQQVDSA